MHSLPFSLLFASLFVLSCAQDHVAVMPTPGGIPGAESEAEVEAAEPEGARWEGRFRLSGEASQDSCGGAVILAAEHVVLGAGILEADVVDRRYDVSEATAERLVAEGRFGTDVCPQSTLFERWTLRRDGDAWTGTLDSTWPDHSDCERACTVRFEIRATRMPE